jgi:hypothetical protein
MLVPLITTKQILMFCLVLLADSGYSVKYAYPWLVQHMPVASFFTLINKFYETKEADNVSWHTLMATIVTTWNTLLDVCVYPLEI